MKRADTLLSKPINKKEILDIKAENVAEIIEKVLDLRENTTLYNDQAHQAQLATLDSVKILATAGT